MDEPSMGLAPQMVELILDKVIAIRNAGTTVLLERDVFILSRFGIPKSAVI
jgi:ABC-type branched-subunit amino acid transport system ATPase component